MTVRSLRFILVVKFIIALTAGYAFAGTYANSKYGFSFEYPEGYTVEADSINHFAVLDKHGGVALTGDVEDIQHYPSNLYAGYSDPFEKFGTWRAMLRCDADGPDGSAYCPSLKSIEKLTTQNGFRTLELMLVHVQETTGDNRTSKESVTGPLYLVDVSHGKHTVVLMLGPLPDRRMTGKQKKLASDILDTITFTK